MQHQCIGANVFCWLLCSCRNSYWLRLKTLRKWARRVIKSHLFFSLVMAVIAINLVMLSFSVHPPWIDQIISKFVMDLAYTVPAYVPLTCILCLSVLQEQ